METESARLRAILRMNRDKPFVKRILHRDSYPTLDNGDGTYSTHKLSWGEADGKYYVFPTVVMGDGGKLQELPHDEAWSHARSTGNVIKFNSPYEADWFSKKYKNVWK